MKIVALQTLKGYHDRFINAYQNIRRLWCSLALTAQYLEATELFFFADWPAL